jgi:hypothetical protein
VEIYSSLVLSRWSITSRTASPVDSSLVRAIKFPFAFQLEASRRESRHANARWVQDKCTILVMKMFVTWSWNDLFQLVADFGDVIVQGAAGRISSDPFRQCSES